MPKADPFLVDDDNPALTDVQLAGLKPASSVFTPEQLAALAAIREPVPSPTRERLVNVRLRVSADTLAAYKAGGPGWETRMNDALRRAVAAKV